MSTKSNPWYKAAFGRVAIQMAAMLIAITVTSVANAHADGPPPEMDRAVAPPRTACPARIADRDKSGTTPSLFTIGVQQMPKKKAFAEHPNNSTERAGFEPAIQGYTPYDGLANRCLQPLGHLSRLGADCPIVANLGVTVKRPTPDFSVSMEVSRLAVARSSQRDARGELVSLTTAEQA